MKVIKDCTEQDNEWLLDIKLPAIERVKAGVDLDLLDVGEESPLWKLLENYQLAAHVFYHLFHDQVEKRDLTLEQFLSRWNGDSLEAAVSHLAEEMVDFFPQRMRPALRLQCEQIRKGIERHEKMVQQMATDPKIGEMLTKKAEELEESARRKFLEALSSLSPDKSD